MNMKKFCALMMIAIMLFAFSVCAYAQDAGAQEAPVSSAEEISETESSSDGSVSSKAWAAAIAIGVAAAAGAISMGNAISKSVEGISRQPEAEGATEAVREYSPKRPPVAPKGYILVEARATQYGFQYYKYVRKPEKEKRERHRLN